MSKHAEPLKHLVSPKCTHPYGDSCGYCAECKRHQRLNHLGVFGQ